MARLEIHFPEIIHFTTEIPVRISDLNYGNHLGNDALVSILHEARVQFLKKYNYTEMNIEGVGIIMADLAVQYKSEVFYNDVLKIEMSVKNFTRVGFEIFYRVSCSQKNIALAKTGIVCFDYEKKKIVALPLRFEKIFSPN
ncbi:MAG: acyl-CoA thioesterase [Chitinophagales bacterium]